ncbi:MAG: molybdopterin molybdotransferase MoeA [Alphaproteobacteria bacterium]|nr:molybdopterin molybdotransferase MoeA [Alphaproteobacteria bacterium SS10]
MLSVDAAREQILAKLTAVDIEPVSLAQASGRVLAESPRALLTQPPASMSAMDGYAVRSDDVIPGTPLKLGGEASAGHPFDGEVKPGHAVRIFTGAVVPKGADAILIQEDTEPGVDGEVVPTANIAAGRNIRLAGIDFSEGDQPLKPGCLLTARHIGLVAAMNVTTIAAYRKPVVAVLSTGDEVKLPGSNLGPGDIVSSSGPALQAMLESWGCEVRNLGVARDDQAALTAAFQSALGADLLLTTGGVSVGAHDLVRDVLEGAGDGELAFWRIAMRPGKPLMFGHVGQLPVLGLPGNPVSSLVCALLFVWPAVQKLRGMTPEPMPFLPAILNAPLSKNGPRDHYQRASIEVDEAGGLHARAADSQDSSLMTVLANADGLIFQPAHSSALEAGSSVKVLRLKDFPGF